MNDNPIPTCDHPVAYFCAEYGIDSSLPIYAGGLGVLAGDTIKAAVDQDLPMTAIGLLYRGDEAKQVLNAEGEQSEADIPVDPLYLDLEHVNVDDKPLFIKVHLTQVNVWMHCWRKQMGPNQYLYLLDTETEQNHLNERMITHALYTGTEEAQIKQQILLGIGGVKLLRSLDVHPCVYHLNEGRPAFLHWQLIRMNMDEHGMSFEEAKKDAKNKTVYTNHTLVAAGNPGYNADLVRTFGKYYSDKMGIDVERLTYDGSENDDKTTFRLTRFALNVSKKATGVSQIHTHMSQQQWPEYEWHNITNGVHHGTWQDPEIKGVVSDPAKLWERHKQNKLQLMQFVKDRAGYGFDPGRLVLGWARRLAGYKHLDEVFKDVERLKRVLTNPDRPAQLLVAGKAHFQDTQGKAFLKKIIGYMQHELSGYALFIPDFNLDVAKMLTRGCDVWLNTPEVGKEACGTSGMKAISNGVLHCTTIDGWAQEVDWFGKGWPLAGGDIGGSLYSTLETNISPLFYDRDSNDIPQAWVKMMQESIKLADHYSARRMLDEYKQVIYIEGD